MSKKVAFIGLGVMGYPMAGYLAQTGYETTVYNRTQSKAIRWQETYHGNIAPTPAEAADDADIIFSCVGNDDDLVAVTEGAEGAFQSMKPGSIFVDHTTASASIARSLADTAKQQRCHFLDAPVSGGQAGAENGQLTIMVGGDVASYETAEPIMQCYARSVRLMGESGAGQLTKMVNQICIGGLIQSLAEGIHFAQSAGLDAEAVIDVISKGAAQSWQMENRYKTMLSDEYDFGFAVDWMRKDLGIVLAEANKNGAQLPITKIIDQYYAEVQQMGGNRWDTSSLLKRLQ